MSTAVNQDGIIRKGFIESEGLSSDIYNDLFYEKNGTYLVNLNTLPECISVDVIETNEMFVIRTNKHQVGINKNDTSYLVNGNTVKDDDQYIPPVVAFGKTYGDPKTIFGAFGYDAEYSTSTDQDIVRMLLQKITGDQYETIRAIKKEEPATTEAAHVVEESAATAIAQGEVISLPSPDGNAVQAPEHQTAAETSSLPADVQEVMDNRPDEPKVEDTTKPVINRPIENENDLSDEKLEEIWNDTKQELKKTYIQAPAPVGQKSYEQRSEDFIAYVPMSGAIYYDEVSLVHDNDNIFMEAEIGPDWSDQEGNVENEQSKAYYRGLPGVIEKTIKEMLGETVGQEFYRYLKEHADKMVQGGYISRHDKHNVLVTEWTDGFVGDGIHSSELDLSGWQNRRTDNGLRFSISRKGEGIRITVYKK